MMAEREGLATSTIAGIGMAVVSVIVLMAVISTLNDADLLKATSYQTVTNETGGTLNSSNPYTLATFSIANRDYFIITVTNVTTAGSPESVSSSLYKFDPVTGVIVNATSAAITSVNVTYGYYAQTKYENATDIARNKFSEGIGNVSTKLPTVLLVVAVVILLSLLVLLVVRARSMTSQVSGSEKGIVSGGGTIGGEESGSL